VLRKEKIVKKIAIEQR